MSDPYTLAAQAGAVLERTYDSNDKRVTDRIWTRARRRYIRRMLALPVPDPRPAWWTADDEAKRDPPIEERGGWCCRTCALWRSQDGEDGYCAMPETPATTNCGWTCSWALCEQWTAYEPLGVHQEVMKL